MTGYRYVYYGLPKCGITEYTRKWPCSKFLSLKLDHRDYTPIRTWTGLQAALKTVYEDTKSRISHDEELQYTTVVIDSYDDLEYLLCRDIMRAPPKELQLGEE